MSLPTPHDEDGPAEVLLPQEMLAQFSTVNVCAPMVRYSKLAFRQLVSQYETHITTTPMMLAKEFSRSAIARDSDFSTNSLERGTFYMDEIRRAAPVVELDDSYEPRGILETPRRRKRKVRGSLIVQFAANDGQQLADAAELVKPWVDGIDLNCGCPQKWAYQEGIGCALLRKPELVRDLVRSTKQRVGWDFPVSVKIRVDPDLTLTNELVRTAIAAGADVLTVHGRTRHQASSAHPVNLDSLAFAVECAKGDIPCMANGDVFTLEDAEETRRRCNVRGVMSARGLLANPALFAGHSQTPLSAISEFTRLSTSLGLIYPLFHRHVSYMLESHLPRKRDRTYFNSLSSHAGVMDYLEEEMGLELKSGGKATGLETPLTTLSL
ncbi:hypothetical protein BCR35DRAFT_289912 [Leucosporidium creatinivorum]|uniref:DUS-like FMN-binding domain-containing protein n=1 Tax=Leucosporidium creatinivorum TaxID=106004 RepID=A0A1Y2FPY0_9BASI|nr:hypothetical protein BCR35DRAFT_289912 [Leucosporidium creatinivorum]